MKTDQARWNSYGADRLRALDTDPEAHRITRCPKAAWAACSDILGSLEPMAGRRILELGSGQGEMAVWMAQQGAQVTGIDVGSDLVAAAAKLAQVNGVRCDFRTGSATELPFPDASFDRVLGMCLLHHLPPEGAQRVVRESCRVLRSAGEALFWEPVENSAVFNAIQNLVPVGKPGEPMYRPSLLQRRAWRAYVSAMDQRHMTTRELQTLGAGIFRHIEVRPYGFTVRLTRVIGERWHATLQKVDSTLIRVVPPLGYLAQTVLVRYTR
jgi:2-polyprenyl-3-methyl-5-hydroxy-6-metoxy-1,4-benzoquinol methylase